MRFWDTSAIVPLLMDEPESETMRALLLDDQAILASFITPIEVTSAIWRRLHKRELDLRSRTDAERQFANVSKNWFAVREYQRVTDTALDVLTRRRLRTADAIQLASAIVSLEIGEQKPASLPFVTLDTDLASAAHEEGFPVLP